MRAWIASAAMIVVGCVSLPPRPELEDDPTTLRAALEEIPVYTLGGELVRLSTMRAPVTIVAAWATWCKPCTKELPQIEALHRSLANSPDARVVTMSIDDISALGAFDSVRHRIESVQLTAPVFLDPDSLLTRHLVRFCGLGERVAIPFVVVIAPDDRLFFRRGFLANQTQEEFLNQMHAFIAQLAHPAGRDSPPAP